MKRGARYEAKQNGESHYFTGSPCKRGHLAKRTVNEGMCIECRKILEKKRYDANPQKAIAFKKAHYIQNAEMVKAKRRAKYAADPDKERELCKLRSRQWRKQNPGHRNALKAAYKADKIKATPKWTNLERIKALYQLAAMLNKNTEEKWHVDHIIPLRNSRVCGLHTYENLQVITAKENMQKHNIYEVA